MKKLMKHSINIISKVIKNLDRDYFNIKKTKSGFLIQHIDSKTQYLCHYGIRFYQHVTQLIKNIKNKFSKLNLEITYQSD